MLTFVKDMLAFGALAAVTMGCLTWFEIIARLAAPLAV